LFQGFLLVFVINLAGQLQPFLLLILSPFVNVVVLGV
jgi:hypothetical protein